MNKEFLSFSNFSSEARFNLIQTLLESPGIDTETNIQIILGTPLLQETPDFEGAAKRVSEAKKVYLEIRDAADAVFKSKFGGNTKEFENMELPQIVNSIAKRGNHDECLNSLQKIELWCFKKQEKFINPATYDKTSLTGALGHYALNLARHFYKGAEDEKIRSTAGSYMVYFAAIEGLALGVRTNAQIQALYLNAENLNIENGPALVVTFANGDEIKKAVTKEIFEGSSAKPLPEVGDGKGFFISPPED